MRVSNVSVLIPEGRERDSGHVELEHKQQYSLRLGNHYNDCRVDAQVSIDGKDMGTYRVNAGGTMVLERSASDTGKFTFFLDDSVQGEQAGLGKVSKDDKGLIRVVFRVEKRPAPVRHHQATKGVATSRGVVDIGRLSSSHGDAVPLGSRGLAAGGTGLTGSSDQNFVTVSNLDYDVHEETTVSIRLVGNRHAVREMLPVAKSNPVPAAVE